MPRKARINAPGIVQHVMARGIEGRDIFTDDGDRAVFVSYPGKRPAEVDFRCYARASCPITITFPCEPARKGAAISPTPEREI